uniref:Protein EXORDIUM-like 7 n=1 Tax=Gossypium raimondii TaxID=29730 RepID=A0A0D2RH03_GOSRA|nr:hypothetical protein B456_011G048900 [Gossypium raimondii]
MQKFTCYVVLLLFLLCFFQAFSWSQFNQGENYEGSSDLINLEYHMGPVLASAINLYIIWYGQWNPTHQATIRDFLDSLSSSSSVPYPSVADWWDTVRLYTDQTGSNITATISISGEFYDSGYSHGVYLSRLSMQSIIKAAVTSHSRPLPLNPHNGLYLVLTSQDVQVEDFCRAVCGFHYFTFPILVGVTVPYAWVGYSGTQCPGVDGMISVIAHELAEVSSNPLINAWYAGEDPTAPTEIADLCLGLYGSGGGGGYMGKVYKDAWGNGYNVHGVKGRRFLVQWVWNPVKRRCFGPNALD